MMHAMAMQRSTYNAGPMDTLVISTRGSIAQTSVLRNNNVVSLYVHADVLVFIARRSRCSPRWRPYKGSRFIVAARPPRNFSACFHGTRSARRKESQSRIL